MNCPQDYCKAISKYVSCPHLVGVRVQGIVDHDLKDQQQDTESCGMHTHGAASARWFTGKDIESSSIVLTGREARVGGNWAKRTVPAMK